MISETDISIIKNMMRIKSVKYISAVINQPEDIVQGMVKKLCDDTGMVPFKNKARSRIAKAKNKPVSLSKVKKEKLLREQIQDQKQKNKAERLRIERQREAEKRSPEPVFKNKKTDYSKMVMVRIDRTTYIYAERGHENQAREDYLKLYKTPLEKVTR